MYHAIQIRGVEILVLGSNTVMEDRIANGIVSIISHVLKETKNNNKLLFIYNKFNLDKLNITLKI